METAQTADYALRALLALADDGEQTITELARSLTLNRAVVQRIVATLHGRAMLTRSADGRYALGPGLILLGAGIQHELARIARLTLLELSEATQEMIVLAAPDGDEAVVIARRSGSHGPLRIEYALGFRHSLGRGASGLVMLAHMDRSIAERLLPVAELPRLEGIREQGYALTEGEIREFMIGVAVPVLTRQGDVIGSLAAVMPTVRANRVEEIVPQLQAAAASVGAQYSREQAAEHTEGAKK